MKNYIPDVLHPDVSPVVIQIGLLGHLPLHVPAQEVEGVAPYVVVPVEDDIAG